ncbi:hypothetical protein CDL15_Pgr002989 [Punica granatum]|uniref:Uncharacterized protein n=1 Tax=Punica granatum TaxID=22663 RepID=A0A218X1W0_PUNGR|nr:hypothetical protein CDL15_Pgr002989 [Punica granatum]
MEGVTMRTLALSTSPWSTYLLQYTRTPAPAPLPSPLLRFCHPSPRSRFPSVSSSPVRPLSSMAASSAQSPAQAPSAGDANVFQLIQAHEEKAAWLPPIEEIQTVLDRSKLEDYPSGSMDDFACDADGSPILAVSSLAYHTKDLLANPKCLLLVA